MNKHLTKTDIKLALETKLSRYFGVNPDEIELYIEISENDEVSRGSGRSIDGFSLYDALSYCSDILVQYGGHVLAAGLTVDSDKINAIPIIPIDPANAVNAVLAFLVIKLFKLSDKAVKKLIDVFLSFFA